MMKDIDRCKEILDSLQKSMRYWGKSVAEFVELYKSLTPEERQVLSDTTSKRLKFAFMSQLTGIVVHEFDEYDRARKLEVLDQAYVLILFENFEYDYLYIFF